MSEHARTIAELEKRVRDLEALRNQLLGMSTAARVGFKCIVGLGGYGFLRVLLDVIHWLNAPLAARPH